MFNKIVKPNKQKGFTLVEVLTVMLVLVAVASVTVETGSELAFQGRYEVTKDRYEKIKKAIIGDPNQIVNGQPNIEGFVKDVGRLPFALRELLVEGFCSDTRYFTSTTCTDNSAGWTDNGYGWKGPYISSTQSWNNPSALSDDWGNIGDGNYGWAVAFLDSTDTPTYNIASAVSMNIQSKGKDQSTVATTAIYDKDYPPNQPSIKPQDWQVNINNISVMVMPSSVSGNCALSPADPATCTLTGGTYEPPCTGFTAPTSRLGCQSVAGIWTDSPSKLCLKMLHGSTAYNPSQSQTITENGREQLVSFANTYNVPAGKAIGFLFNDADTTDTDCSTNPPTDIYQSTNQDSICINTNDHENFTPANCETLGGTWINDGTEEYCDSVIDTPANASCTDTTGTNLGGTAHPKFQITLIPHTTLPTINW